MFPYTFQIERTRNITSSKQPISIDNSEHYDTSLDSSETSMIIASNNTDMSINAEGLTRNQQRQLLTIIQQTSPDIYNKALNKMKFNTVAYNRSDPIEYELIGKSNTQINEIIDLTIDVKPDITITKVIDLTTEPDITSSSKKIITIKVEPPVNSPLIKKISKRRGPLVKHTLQDICCGPNIHNIISTNETSNAGMPLPERRSVRLKIHSHVVTDLENSDVTPPTKRKES